MRLKQLILLRDEIYQCYVNFRLKSIIGGRKRFWRLPPNYVLPAMASCGGGGWMLDISFQRVINAEDLKE